MREGKSIDVSLLAEEKGRHKSHVHILLLMLLALILSGLFFFIVLSGNRTHASALVISGFVLNGVIAYVFLCVESSMRAFSIAIVHWVFCLLYFFLAPLAQYCYSYDVWLYHLSDSEIIRANICIFVWYVVFFCAYNFRVERKLTRQFAYSKAIDRWRTVSKQSALLLVVLAVVSTVALVVMIGFSGLLARSTSMLQFDQTTNLVADKFLRATPLFVFVFVFIRQRQKRDVPVLLVVSIVCLLIADFPFGMSRFNMVCCYVGVLFLCFPKLFEIKGLFPVVFVVATLFLMPSVNVFRTMAFSEESISAMFTAMQGSAIEGMLSGDYDSFSQFARSITFVENNGLSFGYQLLGCVLFFIPRRWWPLKPVGTGATMASLNNEVFTNVACPLPGEAWINFGIIGMMIICVFFARGAAVFDRGAHQDGNMTLLGFYPFACMLVLLLMRGDLMSATAYIVGYIVIYCLLYKIAFMDIQRR